MIQTTKQEKLGILSALVLKLQDKTSFTDQQERQEVLNQLIIYGQANYPDLDPSNLDQFLQDLLAELLAETTKPTELPPGNLIPPELVKIYEEKKQEEEQQIQKKIGSKEAYQDYRSYIDLVKQLVSKNKPQLPDQVTTEIAEKSAQKTIASFEPIAQTNVLTEKDKDKIFEQLETIVKEESKKVEFETKIIPQETEKIIEREIPTTPTLKPTLTPEEAVIQEAEKIAEEEAERIQKERPFVTQEEIKAKVIPQQAERVIEKETATIPPVKTATLTQEAIVQDAERIVEKEAQRIQEERPFAPSREVETKPFVQKAEEITGRKIPQTPFGKPSLTSEEAVVKEAERIVGEEAQRIQETRTITQQAERIVEKEAQKVLGEKPPTLTEEFKENIKTQSLKIAANPKIIQPIKEGAKIITISPQKISFPDNIGKRLEQSFPKATLPEKIFKPKFVGAWIEEKVYTVPAKLLQIGAKEKGATPEWQAIAENGASYKIYKKSVETLKKWDLPDDHPAIKKLENKEARFREQQQDFFKIKKGKSFIQVGRDNLATRIFEHYHRYGIITGKKRIYDSDLKANLPLDLSPGRWGGFLRNIAGRFRFVNKGYERISQFVTRGKYTSFTTPVRNFISQRFAQPVIQWLSKTAVGKAAQQGVKKAAGWLAVKLGVKMGIRAAAVAAAPESAGISLLIGLVIEVGTWVLGKIKNVIMKIVRDPEKSLMAIVAGTLALALIPSPFNLFGIIPIAVGGLGLMGFASAPATLSATGAGISGFFTTLSGTSFSAPIISFVIALFGGLIVVTLSIVLIVSSAFILPKKITETTAETISPYDSDYFTITKTASENTLNNDVLIKYPEIKYQIKIKAKNGYKITINKINEEINLNYDRSTGRQLNASGRSFEEDLNKIDRTDVDLWETEYSIKLFPGFENTAIINTVKAEIAVDGVDGIHQGIASAVVIIGKPPGDCPDQFLWPTCGILTQGPMGGTSHGPHGEEAIDIANYNGTPIYATHNGIASMASENPNGAGGGYYVKIKGTCQGVPFSTVYFHMAQFGRVSGQVIKGQRIGYMSNSGTGGVHLHYEFRDGNGLRRSELMANSATPIFPPLMPMKFPYIPQFPQIPRTPSIFSNSRIEPTFGTCVIPY
jgi:hypothetical protein